MKSLFFFVATAILLSIGLDARAEQFSSAQKSKFLVRTAQKGRQIPVPLT